MALSAIDTKELYKSLALELNLDRERELLVNASVSRDIFSKFKFLDVNVVENPHMPAGNFYLVDKADDNWYKGKFDTRYELEIKKNEYDFKNQYLMQWTNKHIDERVLYDAMGIDKKVLMTNTVPDNACDACHGSGVFGGEECWHCHGEGDDPTK